MSGFTFKEADTAAEHAQIHKLNHRIFCEEIRQHSTTPDSLLVDRFHERNRYFIAKLEEQLVGMVSVHGGPEFSISSRLTDSTILQQLAAPIEVRLLAVAPEYRNRAVIAGLLHQVSQYAQRFGYSDLLISAISERLSMYRKLGFEPMGSAVQQGAATFVPMRLSLNNAPAKFRRRDQLYKTHWCRGHAISLLPGPVEIAPSVAQALRNPPVSHRALAFLSLYERVRARLSTMMAGMETVILSGGGTLANDAVAANLRAAFGPARGIVLSNGEFGERIVRQAERAGLTYRVARSGWGEPWDWDAIDRELADSPAWVWAVHLETSTGVLNDLPRLLRLAQRLCVPVAADCVSSLGAVDPHAGFDLFLASGVSGKALGAFAGLSFVFVSSQAHDLLQGKALCPSFDLLAATQVTGPVSTVPTPLVAALAAALELHFSTPEACSARYAHHFALGQWTREQLRRVGLKVLCNTENAAPTITTLAKPSGFAGACLRHGFRIAHESDYLRARNWGQIATMGELTREMLDPLFDGLGNSTNPYSPSRVSFAM
jgi:aspartate aminotransferase-like enzyme/GNAT superfamily N-acetyltransferase